jgi:hypothetical protein
MKLELQIKINENLYLRDPEQSELGKNIIKHGIQLIHESGFESFTFKKLAKEISTTEAGIYRYFENKHRLLLYIISWYWGWLDFQINYQTKNINDPIIKLKQVIHLLATTIKDDILTSHVDESLLHDILITEGSKSYLTKHVNEDNKQQYFKPYKDLCKTVGKLIMECNSEYKYPHSLASSIIEVAHLQNFFMHNLPALTNFNKTKNEDQIIDFLNSLVFSSLNIK